MKKLSEILQGVEIIERHGAENSDISGVFLDSREVTLNSIFFAIPGEKMDGHDFILKAIENGASVVVCEKLPKEVLGPGLGPGSRKEISGSQIKSGMTKDEPGTITFIVVKNAKYATALCTANFYNNPSRDMKVIGVTGTNGKTTIATALFNIFTDLGSVCGLVSTVESKIGDLTLATDLTTPDAITLQRLFAQMRDANCEYVFMEVSSHGIDLHRIDGIDFTGGIFTNLTQDHLDYHETMEAYALAKKAFFDMLPESAFAITNSDDEKGEWMMKDTKAEVFNYQVEKNPPHTGEVPEGRRGVLGDINYTISKTTFTLDNQAFETPLVGKFNLYNTLAIIKTLEQLGIMGDQLVSAVKNLRAVPGRFEVLDNNGVTGIVDYAHTPDALDNVLQTIVDLKKPEQKLITVIGCGGDRDPGKRPLMARSAAQYSDIAIFTSDNPRTEDPEKILDDMEKGISNVEYRIEKRRTAPSGAVERISNRHEAISQAKSLAQAGDVILVAGKGHEDYQIIGTEKTHFSDREEFLKRSHS